METAASYRTILLTGLPRAGTTLCCHILNTHQNVLALQEPLSPSEFSTAQTPETALGIISDFAAQTRASVQASGVALSWNRDGSVPDDPVSMETTDLGLRSLDVTLGMIEVRDRNLTPGFDLVIKHNALFTALLPELQSAFPVYGIVRNPLAVLASWNSVDLPINQGRIPAGERFSSRLKLRLDETPDRLDRQLLILEWFCRQYAETLNRNAILYYEDFVESPDVVAETLGIRSPSHSSTGRRTSRNAVHDPELVRMLYQRLSNFGEAIWLFYSRDEVAALCETS